MNWPHLLFGIRGRINRAKWWIASSILIIIGFVVSNVIDRFDVAAVASALNRFAAISLAVLGFNLFGDTLRDVWDPKLRGRS